jgi:hypothetical protein
MIHLMLCVGILILVFGDMHEKCGGATLKLGTNPAFAVEPRNTTNIPTRYL